MALTLRRFYYGIIKYDSKFKNDFIRFNTDRITDNFGALEDGDLETFAYTEEESSRRDIAN